MFSARADSQRAGYYTTLAGNVPALVAEENRFMRARIFSAHTSRALSRARQETTENVCSEALVPHTDWISMGASNHFVQLYEGDAHLLDTVSRFTHTALQTGEAAVVIATRSHRHQLEARLSAQGVDLTLVREQGQYIALDAAETLSLIMRGSCPEAQCFGDVIGGIIERAGSRHARVRVFGEMVALLWAEGKGDAALRLEELGNELTTRYAFSLFCAYPMRAFPEVEDARKFLQLCAEHSHVIPAESYTALTSPDERLRTIGHLQQKAQALESEIAARQQAEQALQQAYSALEQHVLERTAALIAANAALREEIATREHSQATLMHREKLAAMGSLLASVAHELNNPLAVVMMQADLLREEVGNGPLGAHVTELAQATERCAEIIYHFLSLARQQSPMRTRVGLNATIEAAMKLLTYPLQVDTITVAYHLADDLPTLWADPHQLQQVVLNLVTNAHQALRDTAGPRQLTITTRADQAQQRVILEVADTGPGIPPAIQQRIFEPFFTTKALGTGTGLGLPLCLGIVEGHGGTLSVQSVPEHGAVFRVELPLESLPIDGPVAEPIRPPAVGAQTILIVDDEPGIVRALTFLLRRDGHTVETATNGHLALAKCQEQDYDMILCDLRMPELDGPGFYRELQRRRSSLCQRVLFLTGDTLDPETQAFLEQVALPHLNKPFTAAMIRKALLANMDNPGRL
jgi:two-component system NtrC family sensor kinase